MKKTLVAILALGGMAMAANVTVTNDITFVGNEHANDRLDFHFNNSTDRTVTVHTTGDATINNTDGYGMENGTSVTSKNILNFDIVGTLTIKGQCKGTGSSTTPNSVINVATTLSDAEALTLSSTGTVSRDVITMDSFTSLTTKDILTLTLGGTPDGLADGGLVVKYNDAFYAADDITAGQYWSIADGATAIDLAKNTVYTYVKVTAETGASPKAIGFVANVPEPATATLSLLALAGLAARRRRH